MITQFYIEETHFVESPGFSSTNKIETRSIKLKLSYVEKRETKLERFANSLGDSIVERISKAQTPTSNKKKTIVKRKFGQ